MPFIRVGYRRLYDAVECSIANRKEIHITFPYGSHHQVKLYMGPQPRFGISGEQHSTRYLTESMTVNSNFSYQADARQSSHPRTFFTEIACLRDIEVEKDLSEAFHRQEPQATEELLRLVEKEADEYRGIADLISGIIGLRFHRQFIIGLVNENFIALRETNQALTVFGSPMEHLLRMELSEQGIKQLKDLPSLIDKNKEDKIMQSGGMILGWLLRAWTEQDPISKFNALFILLEMILQDVKGEMPVEWQRNAEAIRELIRTSSGEQKEQLATFFDTLMKSQKPSLVGRFERFAQEANMPNWRADVEAFRHFNKIRNKLVHHGQAKVQLVIAVPNVGEDELQSLEELVERYVNYALFHDTMVYQSHWRTQPHVPVFYRARLTVNT